MNVSSLTFLNLGSSVFGLLVLKNRIMFGLCVCVSEIALFRFVVWLHICFLWGIYLGFEVQTVDLLNCTVQLFPVKFYVTDSCSCFFRNPSWCSLGLFLFSNYPLLICGLYQKKKEKNNFLGLLVHKWRKSHLSFSNEN